MRTTKPISTISYNSPEYLEARCNELVKAKKVSFWAFVEHEPEDDEAGLKRHIHLFIEPSKLIQTDDLRDFFKEIDINNPAVKPLGVIAFHSSKFDDWYLYSKHDASYLASKDQSRRFHYEHDMFITSDDDDLNYRVKTINLLEVSPFKAMEEAVKVGVSWEEYFLRGLIPIYQVIPYERAYRMMQANYTYRNGRQTHTPKEDEVACDVDTGEVIENIEPKEASNNGQ